MIDDVAKRRFERATSIVDDEPEEAARIVRELHKQYPEHPGFAGYLGLLLNKLGMYEDAAKVFREVLVLNPRSPAAHEGLFLALWDSGHHLEAHRAIEEGIELTGDIALAALLKECYGANSVKPK